MTTIRYQPVSLFDHFNDEVNRHLSTARNRAQDDGPKAWTPAVDIREEQDRFLLVADIPGVQREAIEITLNSGILTLRGERSGENADGTGSYRHRERRHGAFTRQFTLPDSVDAKNISASVNNGVLEIVIPKQAKPEPTRITIN